MQTKKFGSYFFSVLLIAAVLLGGLTGYFFGHVASFLKPLGDIFLNLIFTAIVPLVFFSVSSAMVRAGSLKKLGKIIFSMAVVFLFTGMVAAIFTLLLVKIFPPAQAAYLPLVSPEHMAMTAVNFSHQFVNIFTVPDFSKLLSHEHILALIVFSIFVGLAVSSLNEKAKLFITFLQSGEEIFMRVFALIMYFAPIGFFAYFAVVVHEIGPKVIQSYLRITLIYYVFALIYFVCVFTIYAYLAGKVVGVKLFWKNVGLPMITAIATCSSAASIPVNLLATKKIGVSAEIYETTVPLGSMIHKEGSVIGGVIKIAFLFGIFHLNFSGLSVLMTALGVSLLVGTVMGAIPSGGMLGELLILTFYGFPSSVLIAIAAISIIIDPMATMLSVTGNTVSSMMVARLVEGKHWLANKE